MPTEPSAATVPDREAIEEALTASHGAVFDALGEAFCVVEIVLDDGGRAVDYRFVEVNDAFAAHTDLSDVRGRAVRDVVPQIEPFWIESLGQVARGREPVRFVEEVRLLRRWFQVYAWPIGRAERRRVAVHFTDISDRKLAEDAFHHRGQRFRALVQQAPIGVLLVDADLRLAEVNATAAASFGAVPESIGRTFEEVLRGHWPQEVADEVLQASRTTLATGASFRAELTVAHVRQGSTTSFDWRMERVRLPDGVDGLVCTFDDVTRRVAARHELTASEHRYRSLFESIDAGFCILEAVVGERERPIDFRTVEVNAAFGRHSGIEDPRGRTLGELVPDLEPLWFEAFEGVVRSGEPTRFVAHAQALDRWFDVDAFRLDGRDGHRLAVLFRDVTDAKRAELALQESVALLRHQTHHDDLTGLPNRLLFEEKLRATVAAADRHGRPFAVLFLELDGFRAMNADLSRADADVVRIEVARRLRRALRASDLLARLHGDEFAFVLPEMSERREAASLAEKLLDLVRGPIDVGGTTVQVRAAIGVGLYPNDAADPRALLRAADDAMHQAKLRGTNEVDYVVAPRDGEGRSRAPS